MSTIDGPTIDFFTDPSLIADPHPYYEEVRAHGPVWREPVHGAFVITGYDEISAVYRDPEMFSSLNTFSGPLVQLPELPEGDDANELIQRYRTSFPAYDLVGTMDPPEHAAHRGLMMRMLTPKRLKENEAFMWRLADQVIDEFAGRGSCEFIGEYAQPFALLVIADLLGIPESDHAELRAEFVAAGQPGKLGEPLAQDPLSFLDDWFTAYIEDRRRHPRDDVLTEMSLTTFPDGSMPEVVEVVKAATFLFAGGQGTSARFLGNVVHLLAEDLDLQQLIRSERDRIPNLVEEGLRVRSPVKVGFRLARRSTTLAGVPIPAGSALDAAPAGGEPRPGTVRVPGAVPRRAPERPGARGVRTWDPLVSRGPVGSNGREDDPRADAQPVRGVPDLRGAPRAAGRPPLRLHPVVDPARVQCPAPRTDVRFVSARGGRTRTLHRHLCPDDP